MIRKRKRPNPTSKVYSINFHHFVINYNIQKMKKAIDIIQPLLLLIISQAHGQFTLKGEFRPRFEYRGGYGKILAEDEKPVLRYLTAQQAFCLLPDRDSILLDLLFRM
ncbi:MAG: hypothetical protein MZU84_01655 [Sphingobacterium sp.]|nr:hypothetical protein [Sphingobacterium sp.]